MPPKKQPFGLVPIPKKIHLSQSLKKKPPLEKGGITPSSLPHPKKTLLKKKKNPNPLSPFLKAPFTTSNSFNIRIGVGESKVHVIR
jgi:hypothetical protein